MISTATDIQQLARQGETHRQQGRYAEALADFNDVLNLSPNYAWALAHRAETYFQQQH